MTTTVDSANEPPALPKGGWRPEVRAALQRLLDGPPEPDPVALFDFDNTCILGDIGALFGHYLVETMRYRFDLERFWALIHPDDGRRQLRALTDNALDVAPERRLSSEAYRRYLAEMAALYGRRLRRAGKRDCYRWAVRLHVGISAQQMTRWSVEAIRRELVADRQPQNLETDDQRQVRIERGIRPFREIRQLIRCLDEAGYQVWIVSATNEWTVRQLAPLFGVPAGRVVGNRVAVDDGGVLTDRLDGPALYREGKVEVVEEKIGRPPALVVGDAVTDYEMLCQATEQAVVIDRGDELLRREGARRGWAMQPQHELSAGEVTPAQLELVGADEREPP